MANDVHVTRKIATATKRPPTAFEHLTLHDLRHSIASALINYAADLFGDGAVLGHKDPRSTKRYAHLATRTLNAAILKIK